MYMDGIDSSRWRVRYGLPECYLNTYHTTMDAIYMFSHEIPLNLSLHKKNEFERSQTARCEPESAIWHASDQNCT